MDRSVPTTKIEPFAASRSLGFTSSKCDAARSTLSRTTWHASVAAPPASTCCGCIAARAVGNGGAVALNNPHVLDAHAEIFCDDLRQRVSSPVRGRPLQRPPSRARRVDLTERPRSGVDRHARRSRDA